MRLCVLFLTAILVAFSATAQAEEYTPRLRDYVLPVEEVAALPLKDQAAYMKFLYHFIAIVELSQAKAQPEPKDLEAYLNRVYDFYAQLHIITRAEAKTQTTRAPAPGATFASWGSVPFRDQGPLRWPRPSSLPYLSSNDVQIINYFNPNYMVVQRPAVTPHQTPPPVAKPKPKPRKRTVRAPSRRRVTPAPTEETADSPDASGGADAAAGSDTAAGGPVGYRRKDSACLFGGYVSHYQEKSDGSLSCPAPQGKTNTDPCRGTSAAPKFNCNNFGMATGPAQSAVQTVSCIEAKPYRDLTVRCVGALDKWLTETPPTVINSAEYAGWRQEVVHMLDEYENSFARGKKFSDYCANENVVNENRQKDECAALTGLFAKLRRDSPTASDAVAAGGVREPAARQPIAPGQSGAAVSAPRLREGDVGPAPSARMNVPAPLPPSAVEEPRPTPRAPPRGGPPGNAPRGAPADVQGITPAAE